MVNFSEIRALTFDVFGTVVDWRGSLIREGRKFGASHDLRMDWTKFADDWRAGYRPAMDKVRSGELPWTHIDQLHRMILDEILERHGVTRLEEADKQHLNFAWHRLRPWPDSVRGLRRLKNKYIIATLSNGNVSLLVDMAKEAGLPWDTVLSGELFKHYKPDPETYLGAAALLGARPEQTMMVAAHEDDLQAARAVGLRTAFVRRPDEFGKRDAYDLPRDATFDVVADDFLDLAEKLGT